MLLPAPHIIFTTAEDHLQQAATDTFLWAKANGTSPPHWQINDTVLKFLVIK